ncbi:uncharacterized protein LOC130055130 [Ostrea edulis]|uniref:uncharacterized protein LOC130055130 n=1 Tax=Ostrea edulis TaxID=37623 RepID=UPI0024AE95D0|nr:uncharacterized protein LOC130055130 [Ostrea edulis]
MENIDIAHSLLRQLRYHERARQEIVLLDKLIQRHQRQIERSLQLGRKEQALHYMGCKTVVHTVMYFYKQYYVRSWLQAQVHSWEILRAVDTDSDPPNFVSATLNFHNERIQPYKYHQAQVAAQCSFSRAS